MTRQRRQPRRGLTLLEVLLSLAILILALSALWQLVDLGTTRGNESRAYTQGTRLAQSKMAEVEAGVVSLDGATDGTFEGDDAAWSFSVTVAEAGPPNLYQVTVRVYRDVSGKPVEVVLSQMLFDPASVGSSAQAEEPAASTDATGMGTTGTGTTGGTSP